jgi:hypothetical protein
MVGRASRNSTLRCTLTRILVPFFRQCASTQFRFEHSGDAPYSTYGRELGTANGNFHAPAALDSIAFAASLDELLPVQKINRE